MTRGEALILACSIEEYFRHKWKITTEGHLIANNAALCRINLGEYSLIGERNSPAYVCSKCVKAAYQIIVSEI